MIEVTINASEGVSFLRSVRILRPDAIENGVGVHYIEWNDVDPEFIRAIRALGLRKVGEKPELRYDLYAAYPISFFRFKAIGWLFGIYFATIRWLYDNARAFQQIPEGERFSWRYFTPYHWYRKIRGK